MKVLGLEDIICQPSATAKTNLHMGHPSGWPFAYANSTHLLKGRKSIHLSIFEFHADYRDRTISLFSSPLVRLLPPSSAAGRIHHC